MCVICVCVLDGTVFGSGGCFFKHLSTSLLFFMCVCVYIKQYISHFSVPDNRPMILVTSSTPQATYPGDAEGVRLDFWGQSNTNSVCLLPLLSKSSPFLGQALVIFLLTGFPPRCPCIYPSTPTSLERTSGAGSPAHPQLADFGTELCRLK